MLIWLSAAAPTADGCDSSVGDEALIAMMAERKLNNVL